MQHLLVACSLCGQSIVLPGKIGNLHLRGVGPAQSQAIALLFRTSGHFFCCGLRLGIKTSFETPCYSAGGRPPGAICPANVSRLR